MNNFTNILSDHLRLIYKTSSQMAKVFTLMIVLLVATVTTSIAAPQSYSGKVLDESGQPLIGVAVMAKGTSIGTITDLDGAYTINVEPSSTLLFSYVGYKSFESAAANNIEVTLQEDVAQLEEVVVVGFGSQKKVNLTGAVSTTDSETFEARPVSNAVQALQGAVSGLNITSTTGEMGSSSAMNIRGVATIGSGSTGSPLVLIDGMEGDINTINPQDIESISVLKDAASSSIYGSRAPFGVVLITTKSGADGEMKVNYNNSFRVYSLLKDDNFVNSYDFANYFNEALANNGSAAFFSNEIMNNIKEYMAGNLPSSFPNPTNPNVWAYTRTEGVYANTNWFDEIYKNSTFGQEHNISISGGSKKHQVYASMNYLDQNGFLKYGNEKYQRFATTLKASGDVMKGLKYKYNIRYQRVDLTKPSGLNGGTTNANYNFYNTLTRSAWPTVPAFDPNGYPTMTDPYSGVSLSNGDNRMLEDNIYQQFSLVATILKNWTITGEINFSAHNRLNHKDQQLLVLHDVKGNPYYAQTGVVPTSYVSEENTTRSFLNPNIYTNYSFSINDAHNFKILAGVQSESSNSRNFSALNNGIYIWGMDTIDVTSGYNPYTGEFIPPTVKGKYTDWATMGIFGRLNYTYKDKYLAEVNIRYDGTSRFSGDNRWNVFPSYSVGWNIAREEFWGNLSDHVGMLKLRASYGELGNQNTSNLYPTYQTMKLINSNVNYIINGALPNGAQHPALLNPNLTWERVKNTNLGLDFAAYNNRLTGSFDYFVRKTVDMIGPAEAMPSILGAPVPQANNTDLKTAGWEVALKWNDRTDSGFGYTIGLQLSDSKTKITNYPNPSKGLDFTVEKGKFDPMYNRLGGESLTYYTGQTYGEIWGYETIGIAKTQEEMDAHLAGTNQNVMGSKWAAGDIMFKDTNNDGKVSPGSFTADDSGDLRVIGNSQARYSYGIDLAADYKGFDIRTFWQGVMKRDFYTPYESFWGATSPTIWKAYGNQSQYLDYFRPADTDSPFGPNVDSYYPRPNIGDIKNNACQTRYLQDASYLRLKSAQLGYTFNCAALEKFRISNLRVFASGENLLTFTKLSKIFDPETAYSTTANGGGWNGITYPLQRVISFGINANF